MPGYYVVVAGQEVVIRASGNGHVTGSVTIPVPAGTPRSLVTGEPFRAADAGHVIIVVSVAFPAPAPDQASAVIAPDGDIITSSCRAGHHTATARVTELSATDGRLLRVLRMQTSRFPNDADAKDAILTTCQVLSVAGHGDHVLVQALAFGRIDNGVFTSLPGMSPGALPVSATW